MGVFKRSAIMALVLSFVLSGCGGGGGSGGNIPESFDELSEAANDQSVDLTASAKAFADAYNALSEFDPTTATGEDIVKPLEEMVAAGEAFQADLDRYNELIEAYGAKTASASVSKGVGVTKQSVDPLLVLDIGNLIEAGKSEADAINEMIAGGADPDDIHAAMNEYKTKHMGNAFKTGVTAIVGGGAGAVAGLAAATAGAPVLVVTGIAIGTGVVVGAIWSWCTSSSSMVVKADGDSQTCSIATVEGTTITLPDGSTGVAYTLPQGGPGNLCLHAEGMAPVCVNTTVDSDGNKITTCFVEAAADGAEGAKACEDGTETGAQDIVGADCATDVMSVNASAAVSGGATVTVVTNLPTNACTISYSVVGTDGYTQSGTPTTDASGRVSFGIPEGADGVHDTVSITATASGASTVIGYTF